MIWRQAALRPVRATPLAAALLFVALLGAGPGIASAPVTRSCELLPHGSIAGANDGCTVSGEATQQIDATITVVQGTIDVMEIEFLAPNGARHAFLCTFTVTSTSCVVPIEGSGVAGTWSVTGRIVAADPLGLFLGGFDTYARLDATFV